MTETHGSRTQRIINWLVSTFKVHKDLQNITWIENPITAPESKAQVYAEVYPISKTHNQHGFGDRYEQTLDVGVRFGVGMPGYDNKERKILFYEHIIENILIDNEQPSSALTDIIIHKGEVSTSEYYLMVNEDEQPTLDVIDLTLRIEYSFVRA